MRLRPVTPRFYVVGDTGTIAAVVNNNTDQAQEVKVNVDLKGVTLSGPNEQTATIPSKGRQRFNWNITVQDVGAVGMTFFAQTTDGKYTDAAKSAVGQGDDKTLPVYKYQVPETVATGGVIGKEGGVTTEGIFLPRRFNISQGKLNIKLESSLAAGAVAGLNALDNYPFYDTESVISAFLPNVFTYRALKQLGLDDPKLKDKLDILVNQAIQRLYNEQHVDGGWGWWVQDYSNPIITAYAVIGLTEAGKQGFDINKSVMDQAIAYIEKSINDIGKQPATWQLNRQAFLYYALSQGKPSGPYFSAMVNLFGIREKMGVYARAYLAMAFHALDAKSTTYTDPLVSDLQNRAVASATGMHWEEDSDSINWNTDTRTTAIVLKALVELQPTNLLIPNVVRWLMVARTAD
ncbi:MAG: alpha-2-macroglobulin, partial [Candidatus Koribacter versatilis]|nr:alpha-2-macroglobulin [Candidatus Koribacter versatilis]